MTDTVLTGDRNRLQVLVLAKLYLTVLQVNQVLPERSSQKFAALQNESLLTYVPALQMCFNTSMLFVVPSGPVQ